jgi:hypothetical protein
MVTTAGCLVDKAAMGMMAAGARALFRSLFCTWHESWFGLAWISHLPYIVNGEQINDNSQGDIP